MTDGSPTLTECARHREEMRDRIDETEDKLRQEIKDACKVSSDSLEKMEKKIDRQQWYFLATISSVVVSCITVILTRPS